MSWLPAIAVLFAFAVICVLLGARLWRQETRRENVQRQLDLISRWY